MKYRPTTEFAGNTIGAHLEAKCGSRKEFGRLLDQMMARTRKPRKRRAARLSGGDSDG